MKKEIQNVDSYIAKSAGWARGTLKELRKAIKSAAPNAKESISYRMPYYSQNGRLAYFAVNKKHIGFYWISARDKKMFAKELTSQKVVGNSLHIPQGKKAPVTLIKKIIKSRIKDNQARKHKQ